MTGIDVRAYRRILPASGVEPPAEIPILDTVQQLAEIDEPVLRRLDACCRGLFPAPSSRWRFALQDNSYADWFIDEWGIAWRKPKDGGFYFDPFRHPLAGATLDTISKYPWPDPLDPARRVGVVAAARRLHQTGEYAVILSGITGGGPMEMAAWMMGFEGFFAALAVQPDLADALLDRVLEIKLRFWQAILAEAGPYVDIVSESEDLGVQDRLMISPAAFRQHIKPRLRQLFAGIKASAPQCQDHPAL